MVREAVDIERRFITESIPCSMIGMNVNLMTQYIEFIADRLLGALNYPKIFNAKNPFTFMEMSATDTKTSFFEARVAAYAKPVSYIGGQSAIPMDLNINTASDDF